MRKYLAIGAMVLGSAACSPSGKAQLLCDAQKIVSQLPAIVAALTGPGVPSDPAQWAVYIVTLAVQFGGAAVQCAAQQIVATAPPAAAAPVGGSLPRTVVLDRAALARYILAHPELTKGK